MNIVNETVRAIPIEYIYTLAFNLDKSEHTTYIVVKNGLESAVQNNSRIRLAYLITQKNGETYLMACSDDNYEPGERYTNANEDTAKSFENGHPFIAKPTKNESGTWVTILLPIKDNETGETIAVYGAEYLAKNWSTDLLLYGLQYVTMVLLAYTLLLIFYWLFKKNDALRVQKKRLMFLFDRIRHTKSKLDKIQALAHVGNLEYFPESEKFWLSTEARKIIGLVDANTISLDTVIQMTVAEDRHKWDEAMALILHENTPFDIDIRMKRIDNELEIIVHSHAIAEKSADGTAIRIIGAFQDVTSLRWIQEDLANSESKLQAVFDQAPIGIGLADGLTGIITAWNKKFADIIGRNFADVINLHWMDITHPDDLQESIEKNERLRNGEVNSYDLVKRYVRADGSSVWVQITVSNIEMSGKNKPIHLLMVVDITDRKLIEETLIESERSKTSLLSNLLGMAFRCKNDAYWTMEYASEGCLELTGYTSNDIIQNHKISYLEIINPKYRNFIAEKWKKALELKETCQAEYVITTILGEEKWVFEQGKGIYDEEGNVVAMEGLIIDITKRKLREEQIKYLTYYDTSTGVYNRAFYEIKKRELDIPSQLPLSVINGDMNGLKLINDALGHDQGDKSIIETAALLKSCCRDEDVIARTGGDEFCILLPNTSAEEANTILQNVKKACSDYNQENHTGVYQISISLGLATKNSMEENLNSIIKIAEDNMYRHKLLEHTSLHSSLIASMKRTLFERSQETQEHAERLIHLSKALGERLNLKDDELDKLELLSSLHDIGKIGVDNRILQKEEHLTDDEWREMRKHCEIGYRIAMASPELIPIAEFILSHHERWDGNGYPQGLKGEETPLLSRILCIVDAYDAMTNNRVYRNAMSKADAIAELLKNNGTQFDPEILKLFIEVLLGE